MWTFYSKLYFLYFLDAKNPCFVTKNCWKSSYIGVFILSKKRRNWFHKNLHNSGMVGRRKLPDPSLNHIFNALLVYNISSHFNDLILKSMKFIKLGVDVLLTSMVLSYSFLMLIFVVVGIRWRWFLANMFPLSFKISCSRGQLFWLTTIPFLSQRFCSSVRIRTVVPGANSGKLLFKLWVTVCFSVVVL